jgi:hypothetical protein
MNVWNSLVARDEKNKESKSLICDKNPHFHLSTPHPQHDNIGKLGTKEGKTSTTNQSTIIRDATIKNSDLS